MPRAGRVNRSSGNHAPGRLVREASRLRLPQEAHSAVPVHEPVASTFLEVKSPRRSQTAWRVLGEASARSGSDRAWSDTAKHADRKRP
jgi:hypothetical protein